MNTFSLLCFGLKYSQFYKIGVKYTDDFKEMSKKIIVERYLVILQSANDIVVIKYLSDIGRSHCYWLVSLQWKGSQWGCYYINLLITWQGCCCKLCFKIINLNTSDNAIQQLVFFQNSIQCGHFLFLRLKMWSFKIYRNIYFFYKKLVFY